jgi:hypothetical protein
MHMGEASDFRLFRDEQFVIGVAGHDEETFGRQLPPNLASRSDAVLSWMIDTEKDTAERQIEIFVNGKTLGLTAAISGSVYHTQHEIVQVEKSGAALTAGMNNDITFKVVHGSGPVKLSDVVLWFRVNV